jgi:ABC-type xylose transport system permease subunit
MKKTSLKINADYKSALASIASNPAAELTLVQRVVAPTPKFFRLLRTIGIVIGLVGGAILASPVMLPAAIVTVGGYLAVAGSIVTGVSQTAVGKE